MRSLALLCLCALSFSLVIEGNGKSQNASAAQTRPTTKGNGQLPKDAPPQREVRADELQSKERELGTILYIVLGCVAVMIVMLLIGTVVLRNHYNKQIKAYEVKNHDKGILTGTERSPRSYDGGLAMTTDRSADDTLQGIPSIATASYHTADGRMAKESATQMRSETTVTSSL